MEPLKEAELISLAEDINPSKYSKLCNVLGYTYAMSQSILGKHLKDVNEALVEILIKWKTNQKETDQLRSILASKLREVGLDDLGDNLSQGSYYLNRDDRRDQEKSSSQRKSDIYDVKISESLTVGQCREKLVNKYLHSLCKLQKAPWDPNDLADFNDMHTVVTMVKKDAHGRDKKKKEVLEGSVAKIFSTEINGRLPFRILVSAPAGRGKTTAVAKMAYDWANRVEGSSLENLPLLFVVKLRNTSKQTSIAEAIRSQLLSDVGDLTQEGLHRFIADNQGICHILLDGLDEYAGIAANQGLGSNIVDVMQWKEYPDCRVLVTTRPHLENFFNQGDLPRVYTKMWIEGFSRDGSREYIDKFFASTSNPSKGQGLKDYLDDKPLINELVITPLFCLMVCHLWGEDMLGKDTRTQTELLDSVNFFLMHHANARSMSTDKITTNTLREVICKLGKVALTGLLDNAKKLVFTPHDFRRVPAVLDKACEIGIISKTAAQLTGLPQTHETSFISIEFYHKLAQEHSAGKYLADETNKYLLRWKISKLDRVLEKIRANIGDYENLIRFAAGTDNSLCIRIMEAILANSFLDESERYRILLDCSSETSGSEENVSTLVQRCVTAKGIVLQSPTVYTVVGMQNLPEQLKKQTRKVEFKDSTVSADVTSGLWSCLGSFSRLQNLTLADSSVIFPLPPPPELPSVTELRAGGVTSHSYESLLSSLPGLERIDITVDDAEGDISNMTAGLRRTGGKQLTHIRIEAPTSLQPERKEVSKETLIGLMKLNREQSKKLKILELSGMKCKDKDFGDLVTSLKPGLNLRFSGYGSFAFHDSVYACQRPSTELRLSELQLSTELTIRLWSSLGSSTSMKQLNISDSSLSFPSSPPELPSVTELELKRVASESYEGLLSSLPGLERVDITIDDAERDISHFTAGLRRTGGKQLSDIDLHAPDSLSSEKRNITRETIGRLSLVIREEIKNLRRLELYRVRCTGEEDLVHLIESCRHVKTMWRVWIKQCGSEEGGRLDFYINRLLTSQGGFEVLVWHDSEFESGGVDRISYVD